MKNQLTLTLPYWISAFLEGESQFFPQIQDRVDFVLKLCHRNILEKTGGPFAAAIFEEKTGRLVSVGVNRVVPENCSTAHAEMMAFMLAQNTLGAFDLGQEGMPPHQLVTSAQMCAMCLGGAVWSGVRSIVFSATAEDVERIVGFDEGPIHPDWQEELNQRGIRVYPTFKRAEAVELLTLYQQQGGIVYNGRQSVKD